MNTDKQICKICGLEKIINADNFYKTKSKLGFDTTCKSCRLNNKKNKPKKDSKRKSKQNLKVGFINPANPIPIKKMSEDGYGGKWKFDIDQLQNNNEFARLNGQYNHMSKSRIPCWQVKTTELDKLKIFCFYIEMNEKSIIEFPKSDKTVYVVNLYHKDILQVVNANNT